MIQVNKLSANTLTWSHALKLDDKFLKVDHKYMHLLFASPALSLFLEGGKE